MAACAPVMAERGEEEEARGGRSPISTKQGRLRSREGLRYELPPSCAEWVPWLRPWQRDVCLFGEVRAVAKQVSLEDK